MKEMYYSEVCDKYFDSKQECRKAELQFQLAKEAEEAEARKAKEAEEQKKEELAYASKEKKALADAISAADEKVTEAQNNYALAREKYAEKIEEARKAYQVAVQEAQNSILTPASLAVKETQKAKYEAVKAFNDKFGTYTVQYTGDKAYTEMQKALNIVNSMFDKFWF